MRLWIALAIAVSAFAGYQGYMRAPAAIDGLVAALFDVPPGLSERAPELAPVFAALVGASLLFALTFAVIGIADWRKARQAMAGLDRLLARRREGEEPDRREFLAAFGEADDLVEIAADYAVALDEDDDEAGGAGRGVRYRATVPAAAYFRADALVEGRLFDRFFRLLPGAFVAVGALGLVFGLVDGLRASAGASGDPLPLIGATEGGLVALFLALAFALAVGLIRAMLLALRHQQVAALGRAIDGLFLYGGDSTRAFARAVSRETRTLRRAVSTLGADLRKAMAEQNARLAETLDAQAKIAAAALAESVRSTFNTPLVALTAAVEQATRDENERVQELVSTALKGFIAELEAHFGDQLGEVNALLQSSSAIAADIERAFAGIAEALGERLSAQAEAFASELRAALDAEGARHAKENKALATQLKRFSTGLAREVDGHAKRFETFLGGALDRVEEITRTAIAASSEDLAKTAAAFQGLQTVVESLALSVTPILNQVVDTQERLLAAMEEESAAGKAIAGAASDMNAAARASRETVEKFVVLASALSGGAASAGDGSAKIGDGAAATESDAAKGQAKGRRRGTDALGRALSDLMDETEGLSKELPEL